MFFPMNTDSTGIRVGSTRIHQVRLWKIQVQPGICIEFSIELRFNRDSHQLNRDLRSRQVFSRFELGRLNNSSSLSLSLNPKAHELRHFDGCSPSIQSDSTPILRPMSFPFDWWEDDFDPNSSISLSLVGAIVLTCEFVVLGTCCSLYAYSLALGVSKVVDDPKNNLYHQLFVGKFRKGSP
jgi:hypothetical protein